LNGREAFPAEPPNWQASDAVTATLLGGVGVLLGAGAGVLAGFAVSGASSGSEDEADGIDLEPVAFGMMAGGTVGSSAFVHWYGAARGFNGSFGFSLLGAGVGSTLWWVGMSSLDSDDVAPELLWLSFFLLPASGATVAYYLSIDKPDGDSPYSGALLGYVPERGVSLRVPALTLMPVSDGMGIGVPLLGGRF